MNLQEPVSGVVQPELPRLYFVEKIGFQNFEDHTFGVEGDLRIFVEPVDVAFLDYSEIHFGFVHGRFDQNDFSFQVDLCAVGQQRRIRTDMQFPPPPLQVSDCKILCMILIAVYFF